MFLEAKAHIGMSGRYKVQVTDLEGNVKRESGWSDNILTNNGLDMLYTTSSNATYALHWLDSPNCPFNVVAVGGGGTAPNAADTTLESLIASTIRAPTYSGSVDTTSKQTVILRTWEFAQGAAAGNLSEVGCGRGSTDLFSRALILDEFGNPTTITVLANELLTVFYELRINRDYADVAYNTGTHTGTIRPSHNESGVPTQLDTGWGSRVIFPVQGVAYISDTGIAAASSGPASVNPTTSVTAPAYIAGSHSIQVTYFWGTGEGNSGGAKNVVKILFGLGTYQFSIDPALAKDNTKELTIVLTISWGRS